MSKIKILNENLGKCLTKAYREDINDVIPKFKQFAHFSQWSQVGRETTKLPMGQPGQNIFATVRIDSSPSVGPGEILFGVDKEGNMTWLAEVIDSSD